MIFKPDIFSNKIPNWHLISDQDYKYFEKILNFIPKKYISNLSKVYYSGAFEINSSNYKFESPDGKFILLKKWPIDNSYQKIEKIQRLINWLHKKKIPVPYSGFFSNKSHVLLFDGFLWSFSLFISGNYYSGSTNEFESVAKISGKLTNVLFDLPSELMPELGPPHLSEKDDFIISKMLEERKNWVKYFGCDNANLINKHWNYIYDTWKFLYKNKFNLGPILPCHIDMHPHNLIANNGKICAILDFDSCKKSFLGCSLAFNALKQCRQFLSQNNQIKTYKKSRNFYLKNLLSEISLKEVSEYDFLNLSKIEIMRRLCLIFKINLIDKNTQWNHIIQIQITHLYESDELFKN